MRQSERQCRVDRSFRQHGTGEHVALIEERARVGEGALCLLVHTLLVEKAVDLDADQVALVQPGIAGRELERRACRAADVDDSTRLDVRRGLSPLPLS